MKAKAIIIGLIIALPLFSVPKDAHADAFEPRAEKLFGYYVHPQGISFQVFSGGCTDREDFRIQAEPGDLPAITLIRVRRDSCLSLRPQGAFVGFSYRDLGLRAGQAFVIRNKMKNPSVIDE